MNSDEQKQRQKEQRNKLIELAMAWVGIEKDLSFCAGEYNLMPDYDQKYEDSLSQCNSESRAAQKAFRDYVEHMHDEPTFEQALQATNDKHGETLKELAKFEHNDAAVPMIDEQFLRDNSYKNIDATKQLIKEMYEKNMNTMIEQLRKRGDLHFERCLGGAHVVGESGNNYLTRCKLFQGHPGECKA